MHEILPGVLHWSTHHERIGQRVHSYALVPERVVLDPRIPEGGLDTMRERIEPTDVILTARHHFRHSQDFAEAFGATIHAARPGMHEFAPEDRVEPFDFGDELPGGLVALEVDAICPDEGALLVPRASALAVADGVIRGQDGALAFVPDFLMGDEPEEVKRGLRAAYKRILNEQTFEHLLLAHGEPIVDAGRAALARFVSS